MHYACLYENVGKSADMGELLETCPLAASLFMIGLARCDLYGILPGDPRDFRTEVCPSASLRHDDVAQAIATLERLQMAHRYAANGKPLLYIINYHEYQKVRWSRIGRPDKPLPDCWKIPPDLAEDLKVNPARKPEWYGLDGATMRPLPETAWSAKGLLPEGYTNPRQKREPVPDNSGSSPGAPVQQQQQQQQKTPPPPLGETPKGEGVPQDGVGFLSEAMHLDPTARHVASDQYGAAANAYGEDAAYLAAAVTQAHFAGKKTANRAQVTQFFHRAAANRFSPEAKTDPLRREFERLRGPCPENGAGKQVWWRDYRAFAAEKGVTV